MGHLQRLLLATALGLSVMPAAQAQLPSGPSVRSGRVGIQRSGNELIIRSASQRSVINWNRFSIGPDQIVTYYQPSRSATVLNQVTSGVRSVIRGLMQSCLSAGGECRPTQGRGQVGGGVILVNPAGISVLGGQIITDHTLLTTAGINVQEFISSGVINLTLAGDGLIEIGQGATLSGPLSNPTGLEGLSVVAPRIVVDGSVNIPEASSFIVQPQAKGTTEFVFNNVRPSRSFLKLDPGVHHSGVSTVHEETDRTRYFLMNGDERTNIPWVGPLDGCVENRDCYAVTEHLTTDSTLEREFPLKTYTVATIPTIPSSLWSVAPWAITSTRLETPERPPGIEPSQGCEPNGGEKGTGEAVCVRDSLKRFQRQEKELLTPESSLVSLQTAEKPELQLQTTTEGRIFLTRSSSGSQTSTTSQEAPVTGRSCPAEPALQRPNLPPAAPELLANHFLQTLIAGGRVKPGSKVVGELPDFTTVCKASGDGPPPTILIQQPELPAPTPKPIGGCLQLTAVQSGCEVGAQSSPGQINFVLGADSGPANPRSPFDQEGLLGHVTDPKPVIIPVSSGDRTQLLGAGGEPINNCGSGSTVVVPMPSELWKNLITGSSKLSTNPYQPQSELSSPSEEPTRPGIFESLSCDQLLKPADPGKPDLAQNILKAPDSANPNAPAVLSCVYKETCAPEGAARVQSSKLFVVDGKTPNERTITRLLEKLGLTLQEGGRSFTPTMRGGVPQTDARLVPAGQPLQVDESPKSGSVQIGSKIYTQDPGRSSLTLNDQPMQGNSFVPEKGREYQVRHTNVFTTTQVSRPARVVSRYPCIELQKRGGAGRLAQFVISADGRLGSVYGRSRQISMLPNGGVYRYCPNRTEQPGEPLSGSITITEIDVQAQPQITSTALPSRVNLLPNGNGMQLQISGIRGRSGDGQRPPTSLSVDVVNPELPGGPGPSAKACVQFQKDWKGARPHNASSPSITLTGPGEPVTVNQESGVKCWDNLQPGKSYMVAAAEDTSSLGSGHVALEPNASGSITAGQSSVPVLVLVNQSISRQKCVQITKRIEGVVDSTAADIAFKAQLTISGDANSSEVLMLKPEVTQTRCFPGRNISFEVQELPPQDLGFAHLATKVNGRIVADRGQQMSPRPLLSNINQNKVEIVNVPAGQFSSQSCLVVKKHWLNSDGSKFESAPQEGLASLKQVTVESPGLSQTLSGGEGKVCRAMRADEIWTPQVVEEIKQNSSWIPLSGAITSTNLSSSSAQPIRPATSSTGNKFTVQGLQIIAGNTEQVTLVNQYRDPVSVSADNYCVRITKRNSGEPPAEANKVAIQFTSGVKLSALDPAGGTAESSGVPTTNSRGEEQHAITQNLDLAQASFSRAICFKDQNFATGISIREQLASGLKPALTASFENGDVINPDNSGAINLVKSQLQKGALTEINLENNFPPTPQVVPPGPTTTLTPRPTPFKPEKPVVPAKPIQPSCVTVTKEGDAKGAFKLQLSAGSELTQGSTQFVLSPNKSQKLCAQSPDRAKPVQFVVSETPAPGVAVRGVVVNGQPQDVVGEGTGRQTAQVSVAPDGRATLTFRNEKVPPRPTPEKPEKPVVPAKPISPSCVTVTKEGDAKGAFKLQLSAGSELTQGSTQFVLSPNKSQKLCALSPDRAKPVQFVVSETPAPGVAVRGVVVNGQPQDVVGEGTGRQTAQVSVAPDGRATLTFRNEKVPPRPTPEKPEKPVVPAKPILPSCVTVTKEGDAKGAFKLQLSAGSELTQGSTQFVLSPNKSQKLCALSPDRAKPVQFVVSETPAPGVAVRGVVVNGQPQDVVGEGTGRQTAQVSVAPDGRATLTFRNEKVPPRPTPFKPEKPVVPAKPILPSCVTVTKEGDAKGAFKLQLSAGSELTQGSTQFVLSPNKSQKLCALSPDRAKPVQFVVSETPAPGVAVRGVVVNGQPQDVVGEGTGRQTAQVSVAPDGRATLTFRNEKVPPRPTPFKPEKPVVPAKPILPSCVTVTKEGDAKGAFKLQLSAGSELTQGSTQFVLSPNKSQKLCALSPDRAKPVQFVVSETPAPGVVVRGVVVNGKPQDVVGEGIGRQTAQVSVAPDGRATLTFVNNKLRTPTPQRLRTPIPLPPGVRVVPQPRPNVGGTPPLPLRFSRFDQQRRQFVFVIPGGPELPVSEAAMEQLPLQVSHGGRLYVLRRPQLVRGLF